MQTVVIMNKLGGLVHKTEDFDEKKLLYRERDEKGR